MKRNLSYVRLIAGVLFTILAVQFVVLAQDAPPTSITLIDAITIVETEFIDDAIHEVSLDVENDCWSFDLASGVEVCISVVDGTIVEHDDDMIPTNVSGTTTNVSGTTSDDVDGVDDTSADHVDDTSEDHVDDASDDTSDDTSNLVISITLEEAIAEALRVYPNAEIVSIELEEGYNGQGVWDIELNTGQEVDIALDDGQVLGFGYTDDDAVEPVGGATITNTSSSTTNTQVNDVSDDSDHSDDVNDNDAGDDSNDDSSNDDSSDDDSGDDDSSDDKNDDKNDDNNDDEGDTSEDDD